MPIKLNILGNCVTNLDPANNGVKSDIIHLDKMIKKNSDILVFYKNTQIISKQPTKIKNKNSLSSLNRLLAYLTK